MTPALDLDAYFARIGYTGPREPTLSVLRALHALHPRAIPFENLDPLLGRVPKLDLDSLQAKLVRARRGGYCFEQNGLFLAVLRALGFEVAPLAGRVFWMRDADPAPPRTHMALRIDLPDGPWHADVGFGGMVQTAPLRLTPGLEQAAGDATFRFVSVGEELEVQALIAEGWTTMYRFGLTAQEPADYVMANWYVATHPASPFTNTLMAAFVGEDRRWSMRDNQLAIRWHDGRVEKSSPTAAELETLIHDTFGLGRPEVSILGALYQRLAAKAQAA